MERRAILRGAGVALGTTLAGCTGGGGSGSTPTSTAGGGETTTVQLVDYEFDPGTESTIEIDAGTTVTFVWKTDGHNLHVDSQPDGADWSGHESIENAGFTDEHTFDVPGSYHFWCVPHRSLGMVGDLTVS